jgi:drug/metabolite transporter (DMT)-like permease
MSDRGNRVALVCFLGYAILAGGNALSVRYCNRELAPLWGAGLRFALASLLLLGLVLASRQAMPRGRALVGAALFGFFMFGASFALFYWGLVYVHAGQGQTILALVPLATLLIAAVIGQERLRVANIAGTVLALAGVGLMASAPLQADVPITRVLAVIGSAFCFAMGAVTVRRFPPVHPAVLNTVGMATGAVFLLVGSLIRGETWALPERTETWIALAYAIPIGSVMVFVLYAIVLRYWHASRAAYGFVSIPVVAIILGAWLDNEPINAGHIIGGIVVLGSVYFGALRTARPS